MTTTEEVLEQMLKEETSISLVPTPNWKRNAHRDFFSEPDGWVQWDTNGSILVEINLFHWLREKLVYAEDLDKEMKAFIDITVEGFANRFEAARGWLFKEYGDEGNFYIPPIENSHNSESLLSQAIMWTQVDLEGVMYPLVLLSIHNGSDLRTGYTRPRLFWANQDEYPLNDHTDARIHCILCREEWDVESSSIYPVVEFAGSDETGMVCCPEEDCDSVIAFGNAQ